jgi:hypothetical protein
MHIRMHKFMLHCMHGCAHIKHVHTRVKCMMQHFRAQEGRLTLVSHIYAMSDVMCIALSHKQKTYKDIHLSLQSKRSITGP